ncbi:MAG: rhomboid family intramembrane serine protease [Oryzihumus sp.]
MRSASVGFQCPSCVKEGARTTRSARAPYGGNRSSNPALTSQVLIALNVAVYLLVLATGGAASAWVDRLALLPEGGLFRFPNGTVHQVNGVAEGAWWQLVTSMFTHVEIWHIGFNMVALWVLGPQLEAILGRARFLAIYLLSGLAGSALVYWLSGVHAPTIGASGALFGLMGALLVVVVKMRGQVNQIVMWIGLNFAFTVLGRGFISWQGHLGGFLGGVVVAAILVWAPRTRRTVWQAVGLALVAAAIVAAIALRTVALTA